MFPSILNSTHNFNNKHLKTHTTAAAAAAATKLNSINNKYNNINNYYSSNAQTNLNYNDQHHNQKQRHYDEDFEEEELKLPKIIISTIMHKNNNNNNKIELNLKQISESENYIDSNKSLQNNSTEIDMQQSENFDSDHLNYKINMDHVVPTSKGYDENEVQAELEEINNKKQKKLKKLKKKSSDGDSPQPFILPNEQQLTNDLTNSKVSYNNLRLACNDKSKNSETFKVTLKPKNKSSYFRGINKATMAAAAGNNILFEPHQSKPTHSDIEFYLSSRDNLVSQNQSQNYSQIMNDKLKNVFNYKQLMYLKFNSNQSYEYDSYYNTSRMNIMKNLHTPALSQPNNDEASKSSSPRLSEPRSRIANNLTNSLGNLPKLNAKIRSDYISNSYFALKLPKLNASDDGQNLAQNILSSTNDFQLKHSQIQNLAKELKDEINKILVHYPSINSKRSDGKLLKLKNAIKENLNKNKGLNNSIGSNVNNNTSQHVHELDVSETKI